MASSSQIAAAGTPPAPAPQPPSPSRGAPAAGGGPLHTPTSSAAQSPAHSPVQHRKASSLSAPQPAPRAAARDSKTQSLTEDQLTAALRAESGAAKQQQQQQRESSIMVTPPENLPPSPPLTSQDTDGDADVDTEEALVDAASQRERARTEADLADGWRRASAAGKPSLEAVEQHPLRPPQAGFEGRAGDARADLDLDLEKGLDPPAPRAQARLSLEADVADVGVTKPFEIVRKPKRPTSPKPPHSSYYIGPPSGATAYYTEPRGQIGVHHPREIVRVERDYDHGELVQFSSSYPLELQGRITPTQFLETINVLNEGLIRAHSITGAFIDNTLAFLTLWLSPLVLESKYDREMKRLQRLVDAFNAELYNPQGLNILWPRKSAFLFLEIEYY